jgi:cyclophilin family peptidyl-prolyl cis-trans isomerase/HEAT repeat protein
MFCHRRPARSSAARAAAAARRLPAPLILAGALAFGLGACRSYVPADRDHLIELWRLRNERSLGGDGVARRLAHVNEEVRCWAVRVLAVSREPAAGPLLLRAAQDASARVRRLALFGLAQLERPHHLPAILACCRDEDPGVRAAALAAAGRCAAPANWADAAALLGDAEPAVRGAAALAAQRCLGDWWADPAAADATAPPGARESLASRLIAALARERDGEAHWRLTYALAHLQSPTGTCALGDIVAASATSCSPPRWSTLFAVRGLRRTAASAHPRLSRALVRIARSRDPVLAYEAARLLAEAFEQRARGTDAPAAAASRELTDALPPGFLLDLAEGSPHRHVRCVALRGLPHAIDSRAQAQRARRLLDRLAVDGLPHLRAAAVEAAAAMRGLAAVEVVRFAADARDPQVRAAAARAAAHLPVEEAIDVLADLAHRTRDPSAMAAAIRTLAQPALRASPVARALLGRGLLVRSPTVVAATADAMAATADRGYAQALEEAYARAPSGAEWSRARQRLVAAVIALGSADAAGSADFLLRVAEVDQSRAVRGEAVRALRRLGREVEDRIDDVAAFVTPRLGTELEWKLLATKPTALVHTARGSFRIQLDPAEAPAHCYNLLRLASEGHYRGTAFHAAEPNGLVQGGDRNGDGSSNRAWHGGQLRDELNPTGFEAGVVGMPRLADEDSGGEQLFVTTIPAPHLDGRFTAFGRVVDGMDVVEQLDTGDRILDIVLETEQR